MYAGICASAAACGYMFAEQGRECDVEFALYGLGIVLDLPAIVAGAVVCHMDEVAQGRFLCNIKFYKIKKPLTGPSYLI